MNYYLTSGIINCVSAVSLLWGDVYDTCVNKRVKLSQNYLVSKSVSLIVQLNYAISIHIVYDFPAAVFLYVSITSQSICLAILACSAGKYTELMDDVESK